MNPGERETDKARRSLVVFLLVAAVLVVYAEVGGFAFVRYDDPDYVLDNPAVLNGLSWAGLRWAFSAAHSSNWHPLTWLAHMLDVELYGLAPGGHHWSSVALHALAAVLCFLALRALTERSRASFWASAVVAFLFALHPLRVESVAWVSERKDVLAGCAFFALLFLYARYARAPSVGRYGLLLACFTLGLLAKPMLVSAPFVLLLLDVWPLRRASLWKPARPTTVGKPALAPTHPGERAEELGGPSRYGLVLEKLPLLLLAAFSSAATIWSQREGGSLNTLEFLPLAERIANAPVAVLRYLGHFFWPVELAYFYPHPGLVAEHASPWTGTTLSALALVLILSLLALASARRWPMLFVGWFWFLGMLVPVIGLVQVGEQALADRYAYLPAVGLQLALVFGLAELGLRRRALRAPLAALAVLALLAFGFRSSRQASVWRDSETLFRHALSVTARNYPAWVGLANALSERGDIDGARRGYEEALAIRPSYAPALYGLGLLEQEHGDEARALALYRRASEALPGFAAAHLNLGSLLAARGEQVAAAQAFERVLELFPEHPDAHFNLAMLLLLHGRLPDALPHLDAAVRARPDFFAAWEKLGEVHEALGQHRAAIDALERALSDPARIEAARLLAWILASASEPELRDAPRALELARRVVQATERRDARALETLAAAQAANGDFARAAELQDESLRLLSAGQQGNARARLECYRRGEAFLHEHPPVPR